MIPQPTLLPNTVFKNCSHEEIIVFDTQTGRFYNQDWFIFRVRVSKLLWANLLSYSWLVLSQHWPVPMWATSLRNLKAKHKPEAGRAYQSAAERSRGTTQRTPAACPQMHVRQKGRKGVFEYRIGKTHFGNDHLDRKLNEQRRNLKNFRKIYQGIWKPSQ